MNENEQNSPTVRTTRQRSAEEFFTIRTRKAPEADENDESAESFETIAEIQLTNSTLKAIISFEDVEKCIKWKWMLDSKGRPACTTGKHKRLHQFIFGESPEPGQMVDHRNRDKMDCRRRNMRWCTNAENVSNGSKRCYAGAKTSSRFKGVTWDKHAGKWLVQIIKNYKKTNLGRFSDETEAARTYNAAALEIHGEFASVNTIPQ